MTYELTCINCPMGCTITAEYDGYEVTGIRGNTCHRGKLYAAQEIVKPERTVTALVGIAGRDEPLSVKTAEPVDKESIFNILAVLKKTRVEAPVSIGQVILRDVCGTGVDVIATENIG